MTIKSLTEQEVFDAAWQAFVVENRPRALSNPEGDIVQMCLYRTYDGRRCAIGVSIPDDVYHESFEGKPAARLIEAGSALKDLFRHCRIEFLSALQELHDQRWSQKLGIREARVRRVDAADSRAQDMRALASKFGLKIPEDES